jgi:hypothetical protein
MDTLPTAPTPPVPSVPSTLPIAEPRAFERETSGTNPPNVDHVEAPTLQSPRRLTRRSKAPEKLTYDVLGETNYLAFLAQAAPSIAADPDLAFAYKANNTNPDLLSFEQAMACEPAERQRWVDSAVEEIRKLESINCWEEVPTSEATTKILPGTWAQEVEGPLLHPR